jgi:hypothetical protein
MDPFSLQHVAVGDTITAEAWNKVVDAVNALKQNTSTRMTGGAPEEPKVPSLRFIDLQEDVEPNQFRNKDAKTIDIETSNEGQANLMITSEVTVDNVCDSNESVWLSGSRLITMPRRDSSTQLLLPFTNWHIAKLYEELAADDTNGAYATVWEVAASGQQDADVDLVRVYPWGQTGTLAVDTEVFIVQHRQSRRWYVISGGGGGSCPAQNAIHALHVFGGPTGGTFTLGLTVTSTDTITMNWDDTAAEVKTAFETHTDITTGDVTVTGGPFPDASVVIEFTGNLANTVIDPGHSDWQNLTGGSGVGVISILNQKGDAGG